MEKSVIIEYSIPMPDKSSKWVVAEVRYETDEDTYRFGKPEILSMRSGEGKSQLETLLCALIGCKGEFLSLIVAAIKKTEKRLSKKKKEDE